MRRKKKEEEEEDQEKFKSQRKEWSMVLSATERNGRAEKNSHGIWHYQDLGEICFIRDSDGFTELTVKGRELVR